MFFFGVVLLYNTFFFLFFFKLCCICKLNLYLYNSKTNKQKQNIMKHISTDQKTFGKSTIKLIKSLCPTAFASTKINNDVVIRDQNGVCVCTWHKQRNKNGLIIIH